MDEKPKLDEAAQNAADRWQEDLLAQRRINPIRLTLEEAFAAGFAAGIQHGRAQMIGALIKFGEKLRGGEQ